MTATERLRELLDERGVEWWPMHDAEAGYREDRDTEFLVWGCKHVAHEWGCRLQVDMLTPEQAIAATLGRDDYSYDQWREISDAVADAMEYAHDKAIEFPDKADPYWNMDEYVSRIMKVAFDAGPTLECSECRPMSKRERDGMPYLNDEIVCSECGCRLTHQLGKVWQRFCPNCGRKVVDA